MPLKDFIKNLINSLDNKNDGFSGKKLTALTLVMCVVAIHIKWLSLRDFSQLVPVLTADFAFISVLFGINVVDKKQNPADPKP